MASPADTTNGAVMDMAVYAGSGSVKIESVLSTREVVEIPWQADRTKR